MSRSSRTRRRTSTAVLEGCPEVLEHLPRLGADVARPNQRARRVEGDLPGDVDGPTRRHLDNVAVAGGLVHRLGVDELGAGWKIRGWRSGHATHPISSVQLTVMQYAAGGWRLLVMLPACGRPPAGRP